MSLMIVKNFFKRYKMKDIVKASIYCSLLFCISIILMILFFEYIYIIYIIGVFIMFIENLYLRRLLKQADNVIDVML